MAYTYKKHMAGDFMKTAKIIVHENFASLTEEERRQAIQKNIIHLLVRESTKKPEV